MGLLATVVTAVADQIAVRSFAVLVFDFFLFLFAFVTAANALKQLLFPNKNEPPLVFHWIPFLGSTISYGIDPYRFFFACRAKYGNVFTFVLLGRRITVCLETDGNDMILNGKLNEVCAEDVYGPLATPVFGKDVVYDCPNSKLMEQKKFVKFGLTSEALRSYVPLIVEEVADYIKRNPSFEGSKGVVNMTRTISEITLFSAARTLQGKEIRAKFDTSFAGLYHDLDMGFAPINFFIPWAPIPRNIRRDRASKKMEKTYLDIIQARRQGKVTQDSHDMLWNLMSSTYRDGTTPPDTEVAHMMIALLMAGQHSSSSTVAWSLLRLATRPEILEEMYNEQIRTMGPDLPPLTHDSLQLLTLHQNVIRETLRLHAPIHSIMRKVKSPLAVPGTPYTIPPSHTVLAAPGVSSRNPEHFPNPETWEPHRWDGEGGRALVSDEKEDFGYGLVTKGTKSPYLPFGAGRHRCIGEQFAYVQVLTILATFVRQFRFKNLPGRGLVATDYSSLFSGPMNPANVEWERRVPPSARSS